MQADEPPYGTISKQLRAGQVIPFLGAGASAGVRKSEDEKWHKGSAELLPFAGELAAHLAAESSLHGSATDLSAVADYYASKSGRKLLEQELHAIFTEQPPLRPVHQLLAAVDSPLLIITTNYDDLIERALAEKQREFDLIVQTIGSPRNEMLYRPHRGVIERVSARELEDSLDLTERTVVYKIHGTSLREDASSEQYVITDGDYLDFLTRMTRQRIIPKKMAQMLRSRAFLFVGYSIRDWNVRVLLRQLQPYLERKASRDLVSWAIDERPSPLDIRFWSSRGVDIYQVPLDKFADRLLNP